MSSIAIIDYGMGNVHSIRNALLSLGQPAKITREAQEIRSADGVILPGVGAFPRAMENLHSLGLVKVLTESVFQGGKPFLGICLGMQLLAETSYEGGRTSGLGWLKGEVLELKPKGLKVPHVGWNSLEIPPGGKLFANARPATTFYFDHSYHFACEEKYVSSWCDYGDRFAASIQYRNLSATQFHPEKSQKSGARLLTSFLQQVRGGR